MSKKPVWFKGIFPALVTPFTKDDRVDEAAYRELIRYVLPHVNGVVPCGTTGEFVYMLEDERKRAIEIALDEVNGRVPVVAGTAYPSTRETVKMTAWARDAGVTAALVAAPYYLKPSFNEVYDHYNALNKLGVPLILYNIPQCAGTHYQWWTTEGMAYLENVVGIKDSSGDMPYLMAVFEKVRGKIGIFTGHDEIVPAALAMGADGAILASANVIPDVWQNIYKAVLSGDLTTAQTLMARIQRFVRILARQGPTQAVKEALQLLGLPIGDSRHPMMKGDAFRREDYEEVRGVLEELGKIPPRPMTYHLYPGGPTATSQFPKPPTAPSEVRDMTLLVGEGFAGPPFSELAHIDLLIGRKDGPVGKAIERALAEPRPGHELRIIHDRPRTLLVPTVTVRTKRQAENVYEHAAGGVVMALEALVKDGTLPAALLDDIVLIANVFVHPGASNRFRVRINNFKAMKAAVRKALEGRPTYEELVAEKEAARHPFRYAP